MANFFKDAVSGADDIMKEIKKQGITLTPQQLQQHIHPVNTKQRRIIKKPNGWFSKKMNQQEKKDHLAFKGKIVYIKSDDSIFIDGETVNVDAQKIRLQGEVFLKDEDEMFDLSLKGKFKSLRDQANLATTFSIISLLLMLGLIGYLIIFR